MYNSNFNLKPGDEIVLPKSNFQIINHHALYAGFDEKGVEWIIENNASSGVRLIQATQFFLNYPFIKTINRFKGSVVEREKLLRKALASVSKSYDVFFYNCEHFTSDMLTGRPASKQIENLKEGLQFAAGFTLFVGLLSILFND